MKFNDWVFQQLVTFGAIRDYAKNPKTGKGKSPKGNLSVQQLRIKELREKDNRNDTLWGLIAYAGLMSDGEIGKKLRNKIDEFCKRENAEDPNRLFRAMEKAAKVAATEYKSRYKEN